MKDQTLKQAAGVPGGGGRVQLCNDCMHTEDRNRVYLRLLQEPLRMCTEERQLRERLQQLRASTPDPSYRALLVSCRAAFRPIPCRVPRLAIDVREVMMSVTASKESCSF